MELLLDGFGHAHIKNALHQHLNRKEVRINGFQISKRLLEAVVLGGHCASCSRRSISGLRLIFLQILQHASRERAERLQSSPVELLLLTQARIFSD